MEGDISSNTGQIMVKYWSNSGGGHVVNARMAVMTAMMTYLGAFGYASIQGDASDARRLAELVALT